MTHENSLQSCRYISDDYRVVNLNQAITIEYFLKLCDILIVVFAYLKIFLQGWYLTKGLTAHIVGFRYGMIIGAPFFVHLQAMMIIIVASSHLYYGSSSYGSHAIMDGIRNVWQIANFDYNYSDLVTGKGLLG